MRGRKLLKLGSMLVLYVSVAKLCQSQNQAEVSSKDSASAVASSAASAETPAAKAKAGTKIDAELRSAVDARSAKPGDEVTARATHDVKQGGRRVIRKGDLLVGHVTDVQADSKSKAGSRLAVTFDQLRSGESTAPLNAVVTSLFSARSEESTESESMPEPMMVPASGSSAGPRGGGGGLGSTVGAVGSVAGSVGHSVGGVAQATTHSTLGGSSRGGLVAPVGSVRLQSEASGENQTGLNSVLSTRHGDLRLESGTRMQLRVAGSAHSH